MVKLFTAESIVNEYSGYKNVKFNWFVVERDQPQALYLGLSWWPWCINDEPPREPPLNEMEKRTAPLFY